MAQTVLIADPEHLQALKDGFADALAFSDLDALKALEAITREKPPAVILEQLLASTSRGAALIKRIKADPSLRGIPIIVVTSYALSGDEGKARAAGCDAYVTKPYSPRALLAKIREYVP